MIAPVVFTVYRRPDLTAKVFEAIRLARPKILLIIADGPFIESERCRCDMARQIATRVDWPCQVDTLFSDHHLGCADRMISGITWAFSKVDQAIILEDDCVPSPDFFQFATELLYIYRDDHRIGHIGGLSLYPESPGGYSYHFSHLTRVWGWASWADRWKHYDRYMEKWPEFKSQKLLEEILSERKAIEYTYYFDQTYAQGRGYQSTWDWQWLYTNFFNNWLSVVPTKNLIDNIGFGPDATHTCDPHQGDGIVKAGGVEFPLKHPEHFVPIRSYDA